MKISSYMNNMNPIIEKNDAKVQKENKQAIADIDQIDQHFNPFAAPHHIAAKRPECFLLIVACLNIPAK